jgi:hypothetical protein
LFFLIYLKVKNIKSDIRILVNEIDNPPNST